MKMTGKFMEQIIEEMGCPLAVIGDCGKCPYLECDDTECEEMFMKDAIEFIKKLEDMP